LREGAQRSCLLTVEPGSRREGRELEGERGEEGEVSVTREERSNGRRE
jgi:hypothetical protein